MTQAQHPDVLELPAPAGQSTGGNWRVRWPKTVSVWSAHRPDKESGRDLPQPDPEQRGGGLRCCVPFMLELRRRTGGTICCSACWVPLIMILWVGVGTPLTLENWPTVYSALFYSIQVIEAILMPVLMACLPAACWEIEASSMPKPLHPAGAPQPVCGQSRLWPAGILLVTLLEMVPPFCWGIVHGYTGSLSHWAAGLSVRLHTGLWMQCLLWGISADAVGGNLSAALCMGIP